MIICFECPPKTKAILDSILKLEHYADYSEAISSAIENLSVLHKELSRKGALVIDYENKSTISHPELKDRESSKRSGNARPSSRIGAKKKDSKPNTPSPEAPASVPRIFLLNETSESPPTFASLPNDVWVKGQEVPLERWIFGQYNRLLPVKASCRALAHLSDNKPNGVPLEEAASRISEEALALGNLLAHRDSQNSTARDDALSIAFPSSHREIEKSRLRYASQFVANVNKQGQVSGLLMALKLVNHTGGKTPRLKLTEAGWRFAMMRSPILDEGASKSTQKFTAEERSLLLDHISSSVPAEDFAYRAILTAIADGSNTPESLDSALQRYVSQDARQNLTRAFQMSQRSGVVSRMADLELIARIRHGVRVSYAITQAGQSYISQQRIKEVGSK